MIISKRIKTIFIICLLFFIILANFFYLQIIQYDLFSDRAISKVVRKIPVDAQRGLIKDRRGKDIVRNSNVYDLQVLPIDVKDNFNYNDLANYIKFDSSQINILKNKIEESQNSYSRKFRPISIINKLDESVVFPIQEKNWQFPGLIIRNVSTRQYEKGANINMAHVLGQTVINRESFVNPIFDRITLIPTDKSSGIENYYDSILSGESGEKLYLFDARGMSRGIYEGKVYKPKEVKAGNDIQLTIDLELQEYIYNILGDSIPASVICMIPDNGEILAYVNKPSIDLNDFNLGIVSKGYLDSLNASNSNSPYVNRSIKKYIPGSIMKIPVSIMLLEEGINKINTSECDGVYEFGKPDTIKIAAVDNPALDSVLVLEYPKHNIKKCWLESGHGEVDLNHAIYSSCNYYFYDSVMKNYNNIYKHKWMEWMKKLGFGHKTGIDLYYEDEASIDNDKITKSDMLNMVIGQNLEVTPIQVIQMINLIANNGKIITPHFNKNSDLVKSVDLKLKSSTIQHIRKSMKDAVYSYDNSSDLKNRGTAWRSLYGDDNLPWPNNEDNKLGNITIYAKTGTAETGKDYRRELVNKKGDKYKNPNYFEDKQPNAWYAGYMDYGDGYSASLVVMLENGGKGGQLAADIAEKIFKKIIQLNKTHGYY